MKTSYCIHHQTNQLCYRIPCRWKLFVFCLNLPLVLLAWSLYTERLVSLLTTKNNMASAFYARLRGVSYPLPMTSAHLPMTSAQPKMRGLRPRGDSEGGSRYLRTTWLEVFLAAIWIYSFPTHLDLMPMNPVYSPAPPGWRHADVMFSQSFLAFILN